MRPRARRPSPWARTGAGRRLDARPPRLRRLGGAPTAPSARSSGFASPDRRRGASSPPRPATGPPPWRGSGHRSVEGRTPRTRYYVRALTRRAGRAFATVAGRRDHAGLRRAVSDRRRRGRPRDARLEPRSTSADAPVGGQDGHHERRALATTAQRRRPVPGAARSSPTRRSGYLRTPAVAAADGRVALAWGLDGRPPRLSACRPRSGPPGVPGPPQTVVAKHAAARLLPQSARVTLALDPDGTATVLYEEPVEGANGPVMTRLMASESA